MLLQDGIRYRVVSIKAQVEIIARLNVESEREVLVVQLRNVPGKYSQTNCCARNLRLLVN